MNILTYICEILQKFMELDDGQVYIYNQKYILPRTTGFFICIGLQGINVLANNTETKEIGNDVKEILTTQTQSQISIDIYSYDFSAIEKKEEILMALKSNLSQNIQSKYGFHIATVPTNFNHISEQDGTKILNRFNLLLNVISKKEKVISSDYYNTSYIIINKNN